MATTASSSAVKEVDPLTLRQWLDGGQALLLDVRAPGMFAAERIPGALSLPLDSVSRSSIPEPGGRKVVFQCEVGMASKQAADRVAAQGWPGEVYNLAGGIQAWKRAGLGVERSASGGISLPRQVQIAAGSLVLTGVGLGVLVSPRFLALAGLVGAGLVYAGVTGTCGMAALLARLPHNRR